MGKLSCHGIDLEGFDFVSANLGIHGARFYEFLTQEPTVAREVSECSSSIRPGFDALFVIILPLQKIDQQGYGIFQGHIKHVVVESSIAQRKAGKFARSAIFVSQEIDE
eukprot:jgi/Pico_ML_1/55787/g1426.t1